MKAENLSVLMLPLCIVSFYLTECFSESRLPFRAHLTLAVFLVVTILWRYQRVKKKRQQHTD
jgi:hypothetical protein